MRANRVKVIGFLCATSLLASAPARPEDSFFAQVEGMLQLHGERQKLPEFLAQHSPRELTPQQLDRAIDRWPRNVSHKVKSGIERWLFSDGLDFYTSRKKASLAGFALSLDDDLAETAGEGFFSEYFRDPGHALLLENVLAQEKSRLAGQRETIDASRLRPALEELLHQVVSNAHEPDRVRIERASSLSELYAVSSPEAARLAVEVLEKQPPVQTLTRVAALRIFLLTPPSSQDLWDRASRVEPALWQMAARGHPLFRPPETRIALWKTVPDAGARARHLAQELLVPDAKPETLHRVVSELKKLAPLPSDVEHTYLGEALLDAPVQGAFAAAWPERLQKEFPRVDRARLSDAS